MPILIVLKSPRINLIGEGEIKDEDEGKWDEIFHNQVLMIKNQKGKNMLVPLTMDCNIGVMEEVTQEEVDEQKELASKQSATQKPSTITRPQFVFPGRKGQT